jgi:hypothetical protein
MKFYFLLAFLAMSQSGIHAQCASSANNTADEDILNVTLGTLNNSSTCSTTGGAGSILNRYSNYTALTAPTLTACTVMPFSVQVGTCGGNYTSCVSLFIDWNNDGDFVDAGETAFASTPVNGPHTVNGSIAVPASATLGNLRMRVINMETNPNNIVPCGGYGWGETEDYTVKVIAGSPMVYTSSQILQLASSPVGRCMTNQQIIKVEVVAGSGCNGTVSQFNLGPGSSTNLPADVSRIHIYYTGTTNAFSAVNEFVAGGTVPAGAANTITGSQGIVAGTNYFWVTYDLNPAATPGNLIDASCAQLSFSGTTYTPTVTNPAGSGTITICQGPGAVASGLDVWVKANAGITGGTPVTAWANQSASGTGITMNGTPNINTATTDYNYNPYIDFTAPASPRQFLSLSGFNGTAGKDYSAFFFVSQLNDLSRIYTHLATTNGITFGPPPNGTLHGGEAGATAAIQYVSEEIVDFGTSSPLGTWQRNGTNVLSTATHISAKQLLSASSAGITTINRFLGGQDDNGGFLGSTRDYKGYVAEVIAYTGPITPVQRQRIHTYLAVKYGITLSTNYLNSAAATTFINAAPYNANIIGIAREDESALLQKQSHNNDDTVRLFLSTLAATNAANAGSFGSDNSYIITGADQGRMHATAASNAEVPPGITSRIEREWKVTNTNFNGTFNMSFVLSSGANLASVNPADLRLLIDDDGNFTNATAYAAGGGLSFSYSNPVLTVSGISTAQLAAGLTRYLTVASMNTLTPLPVELLSFTGECDKNVMTLKWATATETNNHYFTLQKSSDGIHFESLADIKGSGTCREMHAYSYADHPLSRGPYYYRLKQTNHNGTCVYFKTISMDEDCAEITAGDLSIVNVYPNPSTGRFLKLEYVSDRDRKATLSFKNILGQELYAIDLELSKGTSVKDIDMNAVSAGIYFVQLITFESQSKTLKLLRD